MSISITFTYLIHLPFQLLFLQNPPLVIFLLSFCQGDFRLGPAPFKIDLGRNKGVSFFHGFSDQTLYLPFVQEEFSGPHRIELNMMGKGIGGYVQVMEKNLSTFYPCVTVYQTGPPFPERLHLSAQQNNPCLHEVTKVIIIAGFFIPTNSFYARIPLSCH